MFDFAGFGLIPNMAFFAVAAVFVWLSGTRITRYANVISEKTGLGQALIGLLLLGGVTSLPELAVAVTASVSGDAALAVNSILGGIAMQVTILAVADILIHDRALTSVIPDPVIMLQGAFKILLLVIVLAPIVVGDVAIFHVGIWMWVLAIVTGISMFVLSRVKGDQPWLANDDGEASRQQDERAKEKAEEDKEHSLRWALWRAVAAGTVIILAGYVLSRSADAIAQASGLGQSFVGLVLVAIATSLPEMSTVYSAMRAGLYTMAMSDIFGTNIFDLSFLFLIDLTGGGDAVMNSVGAFEGFAAIVAISVTAIFLAGLAERRDRTILRMGYDSLAVLMTYLGGLVVLYFLRDTGGGN